jgi:predicted site-specific integrase-resolvase
MENISQWPSGSEAARQLGISAAMVRILMDQGRLRYIPTKLGRLIDPADLARLKLEREANHAGAGK